MIVTRLLAGINILQLRSNSGTTIKIGETVGKFDSAVLGAGFSDILTRHLFIGW